jgi:hypothetical protein
MSLTETEIRAGLEKLMRATLADEASYHDWDYEAVRPMPVPPSWKPRQKVKGDCSKGVQFIARWDGHVLDPMGRDWDVYGNSTTICLHLEHLDSLAEVKVGDIVTFGPSGDEHAAMVIRLVRRNKKIVDLELWSFGHPGAPDTYLLSQDHREYQLLRLHLGVHKPPTPEEILRAKTGYWAWRQWRLGTGAWRSYGKRNRKVRPDVPRRIPRAWWRKFAHSTVKGRKRRANPPKPGN